MEVHVNKSTLVVSRFYSVLIIPIESQINLRQINTVNVNLIHASSLFAFETLANQWVHIVIQRWLLINETRSNINEMQIYFPEPKICERKSHGNIIGRKRIDKKTRNEWNE